LVSAKIGTSRDTCHPQNPHKGTNCTFCRQVNDLGTLSGKSDGIPKTSNSPMSLIKAFFIEKLKSPRPDKKVTPAHRKSLRMRRRDFELVLTA
jgi:hypothetical protein